VDATQSSIEDQVKEQASVVFEVRAGQVIGEEDKKIEASLVY
jgi:hypothetical protein